MNLLDLPKDIIKIIILNLDLNTFMIFHKINKFIYKICNNKFKNDFITNLNIIQENNINIHVTDSNTLKTTSIIFYYCIYCSIKSFDKSYIFNTHNCNICKKILCRNYLYYFPLSCTVKYKCIDCLSDTDYYYSKLTYHHYLYHHCLTKEQYNELDNSHQGFVKSCKELKN